jgi:transcription elongation factor Elf1
MLCPFCGASCEVTTEAFRVAWLDCGCCGAACEVSKWKQNDDRKYERDHDLELKDSMIEHV